MFTEVKGMKTITFAARTHGARILGSRVGSLWDSSAGSGLRRSGEQVSGSFREVSLKPPGELTFCLVMTVLEGATAIPFNGVLDASQAPVADSSRDWATLVQVVLMVLLALTARYRPTLVRASLFTVVCVGAVGLGAMLAGAGVSRGSGPLVIAGACLTSAGNAWGTVVWTVLCARLPFRWLMACVAAGNLLAVPLSVALSQGGYYEALACYAVMISVSLVGCLARTRERFREFACSESAADAQVTRPRAILPLTHDLFIYIFVFHLAYGFALRYEGADGGLRAHWLIVLVLATIVAYALFAKREPLADVLFDGAFALLVCGLLVVLLDETALASVASVTLLSGSSVFWVLMVLALGAIAARNRSNVVTAIAWGYAAYYGGIAVGAQLGMGATGLPVELHLVAKAAVALALAGVVLYTLFSIRDFGFDKTIAAVEPEVEMPTVEVKYADAVALRCDELAVCFGLTERETDVFRLLARGHNTLHIQEELAITKNTLKYHVRHIYEKAGVHSQQELIELL